MNESIRCNQYGYSLQQEHYCIQYQIKGHMEILPFCFTYHLDLGTHLQPLLITHQSQPYLEASKICAQYNLPSILIALLGDQLQQLIMSEQSVQPPSTTKSPNQQMFKAEKKILRQREGHTLQTQFGEDSTKQSNSSIRHSINTTHGSVQLNVFDNLYNNHKEILLKKQLSRQRSFEAVPFKPQINQLSRRIVTKKRQQKTTYKPLPINFRSLLNHTQPSAQKIRYQHRVGDQNFNSAEGRKQAGKRRQTILTKQNKKFGFQVGMIY